MASRSSLPGLLPGWFARFLLAAVLLAVFAASSAQAGPGILQIRHGYFWDPALGEYFVPRGFAYQVWNPPVGADQTLAQLDYDLSEFKKMYVNSVRVEMVWNEIEKTPGQFDWSKPDYLVARAEQLGLRLFVLIGFQYAPGWFPEDWKAVNDQGEHSVVLNYEHVKARTSYSNYIHQVTSRYQKSGAIGGWILGNEYAYFDLWNPSHRFLGFDTEYSQPSFRAFLTAAYQGNIAALNANWGTSYLNFGAVVMPRDYPADRHAPGYHDLLLWREASIADYVAVGAVAAQKADPHHLRTYSMIGGLFIGNDANYTCEDAKTIVTHCRAAGAPLDFWSINNYSWATFVSELRSGDFGVAKHQAQSGLPVMVSETGQSTTDNLLPGAAERQANALPTQLWEAFTSGAIGAHIFTWNDRDLFGGVFVRERGFGIVGQNRLPKQPVYANVLEMFRRMENLQLNHLLGGSTNPPVDVQLLWSKSGEMGWPRANQENAMIWNALRRLGYQPGIIDDDQFEAGAATNAAVLLLSRCYQLKPEHLDQLANRVVPAGVHLHANADLPGQFNAYHHPNANWAARMNSLFGLNVATATAAWDSGILDTAYHPITFTGVGSLGSLLPGYSDQLYTWKIWHGVSASSGTTIVTHRGDRGTQPPIPALHIKNLGPAKSAVTTFALGDSQFQDKLPVSHDWDLRYRWLEAIYKNHFGLTPSIQVQDLAGSGTNYVIADYRACENGSLLLSLLNTHTRPVSIRLSAPGLLLGKTVENLTAGGIVELGSDGVLTLELAGDQFALLYAYSRSAGVDQSLLNPNPNKLWIQSAPPAVWPDGVGQDVAVGYDTADPGLTLFVSLERILTPNKVLSRSAGSAITGQGTATLHLIAPDADLNDIDYVSSEAGAQYLWHAWLEKNGVRVCETALPVRVSWGVRPRSLPASVTPGASYSILVDWENLPSFAAGESSTPLSRADVWDPVNGQSQYYEVVLEVRGPDGVVAADRFLTSTGTDSHAFAITVPTSAIGPFTWAAYLRPSPGASVDVTDGFENRGPGDDPAFLSPWQTYVYSALDGLPSSYLAQGLQTADASEGKQSAFLVAQSSRSFGSYPPGFGIVYTFPHNWALPANRSQWTPYTFFCDFKEAAGLDCLVELQLKDDLGGLISFTNRYRPGPNGWTTIGASLDRFFIPTYVPFFNEARVHQLVINVQMLTTNAVYLGAFDRIRFDGPEKAVTTGFNHEVQDSFEDRIRGNDPEQLKPWGSYVYSQFNNAQYLAQGIQDQATDGFQSAFMVVQNPPEPGDYAGFGLYYTFPQKWALPADPAEWKKFAFSYDFQEANGTPCQIEMQVKSGPNSWIEFAKTYTPGPGRWDHLSATLDQFISPPGLDPFNPAQVDSIVVNVRMGAKDKVFFGAFDNLRFDGPETPFPPELGYGVYLSGNDSLPDSDHDGIPDLYETGTGVYRSLTNTGTNPNRADTDGDGLTDAQELVAGTDPNLASDRFRIDGITVNAPGDRIISWLARPNRLYSVSFVEGPLYPGAPWWPLDGATALSVTANGRLQVRDAGATSGQRYYRVSVRQP